RSRRARRQSARGLSPLPRAVLEHGIGSSHSRERELQEMTMKIVIAGQGAFGIKHLEAIQKIADIEVVSLAGGSADSTQEVAEKFRIPHWSLDLAECLRQPGVQAAILATPTQMHARQAIQCLQAGKHVQVEIPMADKLADAEEIAKVQAGT